MTWTRIKLIKEERGRNAKQGKGHEGTWQRDLNGEPVCQLASQNSCEIHYEMAAMCLRFLWCKKCYIRQRKTRKKWVTKFPGIPFQSHMPTRCSIPFPSRPSFTIWVLQHLYSHIDQPKTIKSYANQHAKIPKFRHTDTRVSRIRMSLIENELPTCSLGSRASTCPSDAPQKQEIALVGAQTPTRMATDLSAALQPSIVWLQLIKSGWIWNVK